jgi:hypothetical protein
MGHREISWQHTNRRQDSFVIDGRRRDLEEPVGYAEILRDLGGCPGIALLAIFLENTIADTSLRAVLGYPAPRFLQEVIADGAEKKLPLAQEPLPGSCC